jgi:thiamine-phosphate pyrophosphorylase
MRLQREHMLLYAVTDRSWLKERSLAQMVEEALIAGVTLVQYRDKESLREERIAEAKRLHEITKRYGVPLIINDDIEAAALVNAEGVHLGQEDTSISYARSRLGRDIIIGATAHTVEEALAAQAAGADYLGAGAVFTSTTKSNTIPMSLDTLAAICKAVTIPVVAIGGITRDNIHLLKGTQIDGVAVVSAIFASRNIGESVKDMKELAKLVSGRNG